MSPFPCVIMSSAVLGSTVVMATQFALYERLLGPRIIPIAITVNSEVD
jgi:hypothetical protein